MPRRNRVDPWGDLHAVPERGLFTGNRGCLVDDNGELARHHRGPLWITCVTDYQGWRHPLDAPRRWTPIFFLDDAVALAAGHRPCGLCRRSEYLSYRNAVAASGGAQVPGAVQLNRMLAGERLRRGRGLDRGVDRITWHAPMTALPSGTVIVHNRREPRLVLDDRLMSFSFSGWGHPRPRARVGTVEVLTPPTTVAALQHGFVPTLHPSVDV
jgi:hypothetical protein